MVTLLPGYPVVMRKITDASPVLVWQDFFGGSAHLLKARCGAVQLLVLDAPHLYAREGSPYNAPNGPEWSDNAERFAALAMAAARIGRGELARIEAFPFLPDVIHAHDWHAALVPACLRFHEAADSAPATVLTVHNLAFQGQFDGNVFSRLGLPSAAFTPDGVEYHGQVNYLKAGVLLADAITTVSPTYAEEISTPEGGMGLDAMLRWRGTAVSGIVNGIDVEVWDPETDSALAAHYTASTLDARRANMRAVEAHFGLAASDAPLLCVVSRVTWQKGIDLIVDGLDDIVAMGARLVVLGAGDHGLESALRTAAARHPQHVAVHVGYDEKLSHLMQAGCDAILIPSRFEPCGLTQLYGLSYGCVPIVARVGGLADTVIDANDAAIKAGVATGMHLASVTREGLVAAIAKAVHLYAQPAAWRSLQRAGMKSDVSWNASAAQYADLYASLVATLANR
jgi:starch synthase